MSWSGTFVYKIGYRLVGYAAVVGEAYFAGPRVRVAVSDSSRLYLRLEFAQAPAVKLGMREAFVAGKTAATHLRGHKHFRRAFLCQGYDFVA